jgi:hypothetical protein
VDVWVAPVQSTVVLFGSGSAKLGLSAWIAANVSVNRNPLEMSYPPDHLECHLVRLVDVDVDLP